MPHVSLKSLFVASVLGVGLTLLSGCVAYIAPGARADLKGLAPADIEAGFAVQPSKPFPATIAAVRLQSSAYSNFNLRQKGGLYNVGKYSVITTREVEDATQVERLTRLPQVTELVGLNRLVLPTRIDSEKDLRLAASRLQADLLLLYTFDTAFYGSDAAKPLTVITLGLSPTRKVRVTTTASAVLMDTRTGFLYGVFETSNGRDTWSTSWGTKEAADLARRENEKAAFQTLVDEIVKAWPALTERYGKRG